MTELKSLMCLQQDLLEETVKNLEEVFALTDVLETLSDPQLITTYCKTLDSLMEKAEEKQSLAEAVEKKIVAVKEKMRSIK